MARPELPTPLQEGTDLNQALRFHSRERRRSLAGIPELFRTHRIFGGTTMPVALIATGTIFEAGVRLAPVTFKTAIRVLPGVGVRQGMVFEFGSVAVSVAIWIEDTLIGVRAGGAAAGTTVALATFDNVVQLPASLEAELVLSVNPGTGEIRLWANGQEAARATATDGNLDPLGWSDTGDGSFAAAVQGSAGIDIPIASRVAPENFEVIEPLSVYARQKVRHFV